MKIRFGTELNKKFLPFTPPKNMSITSKFVAARQIINY